MPDRKSLYITTLTPRGKYDELYIDYLIRLLRACKANGLRVCEFCDSIRALLTFSRLGPSRCLFPLHKWQRSAYLGAPRSWSEPSKTAPNWISSRTLAMGIRRLGRGRGTRRSVKERFFGIAR